MRKLLLSACALTLIPTLAAAQLRVCTYNVTNYGGGREADFQKIFYEVYQNRSLAPDIIIAQEFLSSAGLNAFRNLLNTAPGSPGDWATAPFIDGADTEGVFFYRTSKVEYLGVTLVAVGSSSSDNQPRNTYRYDVRPVGYSSPKSILACYNTHMKAGSTTTDLARRLVEAQRIRTDATNLPADWNFLIGGDFNIQSSSQSAYQELVGLKSDNSGRFFDPINTPGNWNNSGSYRFVHTQDPASQMDDRLDMLLISESLRDGQGFDYRGSASLPYSNSTWNDPNHSYRVWGNDGQSFDSMLQTTSNTMVGPSIAQALISTSLGNGHLPVYLDLRVPAKASADAAIDFGFVGQGSVAQRAIEVWNSGNTDLWTNLGIANLLYSFQSGGDFGVPSGQHSDAPGGGKNSHGITLNTSTPGWKRGTISILTNDPDQPVLTVSVSGYVIGRTVRIR